MTKYVCNPITVDAFQIIEIIKCDIEKTPGGKREIIIMLDNGESYNCPPTLTSRMIPAVGDYLVRTHTPDEYEYLNPKHVFEAKYRKLPNSNDEQLIMQTRK